MTLRHACRASRLSHDLNSGAVRALKWSIAHELSLGSSFDKHCTSSRSATAAQRDSRAARFYAALGYAEHRELMVMGKSLAA